MSQDAGRTRSPFCRPHDPPDLKTVVQGTLCHITPEALDALCAPLPGPHAPVSGSRQPAVARRALQARAVAARGGVRLCDGAPSTVDIMHLPGWALLLERVGEVAMHRLLRHLTLFWPLPNDCMLQLTGPQLSQGVAPSFGPQLSRPCAVAGKRAARTPPELDEPFGGTAGDDAAGSSTGRTKRPRLSSWRRRKAKSAASEAALASSGPAPAAPVAPAAAVAAARKRPRTGNGAANPAATPGKGVAPGSEAATPASSSPGPCSASSASASAKAAKQLIRDIDATSGGAP